MGGKRSKKKKTKTKAQKMAIARKEAGKTISQVKAANKKSMRDAAAARHAKFKQTKVQTFGGKKTSFSKSEQKRITNAGYSVQGYSKAKPNLGAGTAAMVTADNAQYGNTFPSGAIGISEEGKAQAAANLAARTAPEGGYTISEAGRKQAEANRAEAAAKAKAEAAAKAKAEAAAKKAAEEAAKKEATRKSTFDPNRVLNYAKGLNLFNTANIMAPGGNLGSWYNTGSDLTKSFKQVMGDEISMSQRTQGVGKGAWNPFRGMPGYGSVKNVLSGKPFNTKFEGGFETGPTEANRRVFNNLSKVGIGAALFNQGRTGSITDQIANETIGKFNPYAGTAGTDQFSTEAAAARERGPLLSIGNFKVPEFGLSEYMGINTADRSPKNVQVASANAGGLNIGGGEAEGSKTGRTLTARFNKPGLDTLAGGLDFATNDRFDFDNLGKGLFGYGAVTPSNVINDAMSVAQNKNLTVKDMGTFLNTVKDISTSDDKLGTVKNIIADQDTTSRLLGPVYNQLRDSEIVDSLATKKLGLPDNYGEQLDQTKGALETAYNKLGTDDKANRRIISDLFIGKDPNLNLLKRGAEQFTNESGTIANYQDKTNLAKFQDSFKENSPLFKGLNKDERGLKGSLGNWRLSNLGTKIVGDNLEGTNNVADLASNIINTAGTNKATQSFVKTVQGGAPTVKSIIGGAIPKFGGRTGGSNIMNRLRSSAGSNATTLAAATPTSVEEVLPLPTTTTQTGTNAGNLASIMQNAYQNQMSLYGMNPNYSANFRQPRFNRPRKRFRQVFNRGYF